MIGLGSDKKQMYKDTKIQTLFGIGMPSTFTQIKNINTFGDLQNKHVPTNIQEYKHFLGLAGRAPTYTQV